VNLNPEVLLSDKVLLDLLPEKKGFIKKHAEYLITYDGIGTQVYDRIQSVSWNEVNKVR
jgi:hypothetical protein